MARPKKITDKQREAVLDRMPKGLARVLADRKASADSDALLTDIIEVWGGTRQLAVDLHAEFQKAAPGGMARQRIIEMIQRLIVSNTNNEIGKTLRPSDMTDEELADVAMSYARRVVSDQQGDPI